MNRELKLSSFINHLLTEKLKFGELLVFISEFIVVEINFHRENCHFIKLCNINNNNKNLTLDISISKHINNAPILLLAII